LAVKYVAFGNFQSKLVGNPVCFGFRSHARCHRLAFELCGLVGACCFDRYEFVYVVDIIVQCECFVAVESRLLSFVGSNQLAVVIGRLALMTDGGVSILASPSSLSTMMPRPSQLLLR